MADKYLPINYFEGYDKDRSSFPIRNFPANKREFSVDIFPENLLFVGEEDVVSPRQTVLIRNDGFADLVINDVIVVGPFALVGTKPVKINRDETLALEVTFTAKGAETQTGGLALVIPNAAGRTFIPFSGSVPEIEG